MRGDVPPALVGVWGIGGELRDVEESEDVTDAER